MITRPLQQSASLSAAILQYGDNPIVFPAIEIVPIDTVDIKKIRSPLADYDYAIFVSANAAEHALTYFSNFPATLPAIAIGHGTAKALKKYNIIAQAIPDDHDSEGLLSLPILQNVAERRIIIFCGKNPRSFLRQSLQAKGAWVEEFICYARRCPLVESAIIKNLMLKPIDIIVSTSSEGLNNLWCLWKNLAEESWLQSKTWIVISLSMRTKAQQCGITKIIVASGASDDAIVKAIEEAKCCEKTM